MTLVVSHINVNLIVVIKKFVLKKENVLHHAKRILIVKLVVALEVNVIS